MNAQWWRSIFSLLALIMISISPAGAATDEQVASVMAGGQKYLLDTFVQDPDDATKGYWTGSYSSSPSLPDTAAAVAALIETGKYDTDINKAKIDKAVRYLLTHVQLDGGIHDNTWEATYLTGLNLVALSLYGQQASVDAAFDTVIQNAVNYLVTRQSLDGGWTYNPTADTTYSDMSNTQFGVMGVYYGSSYLHIPINADTAGSWAAKLYAYLQHMQHADGHCAYYNYGSSISDYTNESMTGACLWSLAMIGKGNSPEAVKAIGWFAENYRWTLGSKDYYFVYAMAKALAGTVGAGNTIGAAPNQHDWLTDLKDTLFVQAIAGASGTDHYTWADEDWLSSYPRLTVAFNLMSLTFADPNQDSPSKLLPEQPDSDIPAPNQGLVRLETTGGVTISVPSRGLIAAGTKQTGVELPIGSFNFTLNGLTSATTVLRIVPPVGSLDPANSLTGFLNADGTIKAGLTWFKLVGGAWKGLPDVPINLGPEGGPYTYIEVTLTDNGEEDTDATVGVIRDPGAPGVGFVASVDDADDGGNSNCFIATAAYGSNMAADVMLLRKFRDSVLLTNAFGRMLVDTYYAVSPPIAAFIADHAILRATTRAVLAPIVFTVKYPWGSLGILILAGLFAGFVVRRLDRAA